MTKPHSHLAALKTSLLLPGRNLEGPEAIIAIDTLIARVRELEAEIERRDEIIASESGLRKEFEAALKPFADAARELPDDPRENERRIDMTYTQGYRAGLEAAAEWHKAQFANYESERDGYMAIASKPNAYKSYRDLAVTAEQCMDTHRACAIIIRSLPVPEMVLVPKEPTQEMLEFIENSHLTRQEKRLNILHGFADDLTAYRELYSAMIGAREKP
jgi:hypothetical protein